MASPAAQHLFVDVSVGYNTACGLTSGGALFRASESWGNLTCLQRLGGSLSGRHAVCGLNTAGTAICWGDNTLGQSTPPVNGIHHASGVFPLWPHR